MNYNDELKAILPLLRRVVSDLEMLRYQPFQYDAKYSSLGDSVNPNDKILERNCAKVDLIIQPIFAIKGIDVTPVNYTSKIPDTGDEILNETIRLYQKMNFLLDPDNF